MTKRCPPNCNNCARTLELRPPPGRFTKDIPTTLEYRGAGYIPPQEIYKYTRPNKPYRGGGIEDWVKETEEIFGKKNSDKIKNPPFYPLRPTRVPGITMPDQPYPPRDILAPLRINHKGGGYYPTANDSFLPPELRGGGFSDFLNRLGNGVQRIGNFYNNNRDMINGAINGVGNLINTGRDLVGKWKGGC